MRDCIAWLLSLFLPAQGKRRAAPAPILRRVPRPLPAPQGAPSGRRQRR